MKVRRKGLARERRHLDLKLGEARDDLAKLQKPRAGWLRALRESLGMSAEHLGERLGISKQSVLRLEERERKGTITLEALNQVAQALSCELIYAVVPTESLESIVERRARGLAREILERISHSMALEDQALDESINRDQLEELVGKIKTQLPPELWAKP